ncbi:MAG: penicillin-binding transpeptidase domain-containing protein [Clostridiales bacterium]|jgi:penicillin-binding protein 2|nr:penicillin-binding transpeptidase domain-containing protein [Clostridiales bacterium]MDD2571907.1 penicillin-binding transpeptidase domain-containing protein [Eubacteriales bacterium]MDD4186588.1 penicillin-binding transpeptidase domain-containing protein [Eubacteriales bacterium]MDY0120240.1 penicillin-binding transpeptidase domain-containing protein [Clostridia bacterium]
MADKASIQKAGKLKDREFFSGSRRFALLAGLISMILLVVLLRTGSLQLFGDHDVAIPETVGRMSEIKLDAPRGDIVDRNGVPLAVSDAVNRVEMVSARMTNEQLNRYLLDIARLFDEYGCPFNSPLLKWFDVPSEYRSLKLLETSESLPFVFRQSYDEIFLWQTDRDLFNLTDPEKATTERLRRRMVREDPDDFFDYLLYDFFVIEPDRSSGSRLYTDGEAFTIMQLRYLLLENNWLFVSGQPIVLADEVPESLSARLVEQNYRFPGLVVTRHYKRRYTDDARYVGHALGYVGLISSNEYNRLKNDGYGINDVVGKTGVEQAAERYLRGESGRMTLNSWYGEGASDPVTYPGDIGMLPMGGHEVKMTLDMDLQKVAVEELEIKIMEYRGSRHRERIMEAPGGCVIVLDAKTGAVLANANYPNFDPADFVTQDVNPDAAARVSAMLRDVETRPLLNRGIAETYTPGSTFKPITGIAALEAGAISPFNNELTCHGAQEIGGFLWRCYAYHGEIDFSRAVVTSCNLYFFQIAVETGIDKISEMGKRLGLGEMPGLDIGGEVAGVRPSREVKKQLNSRPEDQTWFIADTCQTSIGQFYNSYSMIQMARAVAGYATNELPTPHFIKEIVAQDGSVLIPERIENTPLGLSPQNMAALREGMVALSKERTNRTGVVFHDFPIRVACKTGTAEAYNEKMEPISNSVFVCYAPADDPEIVIAHAISDGPFGEYSADISYRIMCEYFGVEPTHARMGNYDEYRGR